MQHPIQRFMYHSVLASTTKVESVPGIVKAAREFNASQGITGLLLFDGERFIQYVEGYPQAITDLCEKLQRDPRHTNLTTQLNILEQGSRLFPTWSMGYVHIDSCDPLFELSCLQGEQAVQKMAQLLPEFDFG